MNYANRQGAGLIAAVLALMLACIAAVPAQAHHSTAAYDYTKAQSLQGTVKAFFWTNPHMFIDIVVRQPNGRSVVYNIECGTPNINVRHGWHEKDIKPGDKLAIKYAPMRNGSPAGSLIEAKLADGRILYGPAHDIAGVGGLGGLGGPGGPPPHGPGGPPPQGPSGPPPR